MTKEVLVTSDDLINHWTFLEIISDYSYLKYANSFLLNSNDVTLLENYEQVTLC